MNRGQGSGFRVQDFVRRRTRRIRSLARTVVFRVHLIHVVQIGSGR